MNAEKEGRTLAAKFRADHRLGASPLGDLVALIELTQQIDVAVLDVNDHEHGMTMRDPQRDVVVLAVARTKHVMRQRSTLAHELGHVISDDCAPPKADHWDRRSPEEIRADSFARHLLVPLDGVRAILGERRSISGADLSALVQHFQASPQIVTIQLREARYIDDRLKQKWMTLRTPELALRFGWSDQYHAMELESETRRAPQRLLARAVSGYVAGVVSSQALARLRGVDVKQVEAELDEAGIHPQAPHVVWADPTTLPVEDVDFSALDALDEGTSSG